MITSESLISSGLRGALSWYLGSLIKVSRKLIKCRDQMYEIRDQQKSICKSVHALRGDQRIDEGALFVHQRAQNLAEDSLRQMRIAQEQCPEGILVPFHHD